MRLKPIDPRPLEGEILALEGGDYFVVRPEQFPITSHRVPLIFCHFSSTANAYSWISLMRPRKARGILEKQTPFYMPCVRVPAIAVGFMRRSKKVKIK